MRCWGWPSGRIFARLLAAAGATREAVHAYRQALPAAQRPLSLLIDLLHLHYRHRDLPAYAKDAWHSFTLLGQYGHPLRERFAADGLRPRHPPGARRVGRSRQSGRSGASGQGTWLCGRSSARTDGHTTLVAVEGPAPSAVEAGRDRWRRPRAILRLAKPILRWPNWSRRWPPTPKCPLLSAAAGWLRTPRGQRTASPAGGRAAPAPPAPPTRGGTAHQPAAPALAHGRRHPDDGRGGERCRLKPSQS